MKKPPEMEHPKHGKYLRDAVYGASDGIVSTFAVVSGVLGASLSPPIVLILGFANLIADGLSMAVGNYLGTKSEEHYNKAERARETWEIDNVPEEERNEIRTIFRKKGFRGALLDKVVKKITGDRKVWVDTMMVDELGIIEDRVSPKKAASITFVSFFIAGLFPLLSFVIAQFLPLSHPFILSFILTACALIIVGLLKSKLTLKNKYVEAMQMLFLGGLAAAAAYLIGYLVSLFV